jgi:hypothetical protein
MFFQTLPVSLLPQIAETLTRAILVLGGQRVLLDAQLADLYGITTKALNQAVKRNAERFPKDFMFRLTQAETEILNRSQIVTGSQKHRDPRFPPYVFTEHGAIMAPTSARLSGRLHASGGVRFGLPYGIEDTMIDEAEAQGSGGEMGAI